MTKKILTFNNGTYDLGAGKFTTSHQTNPKLKYDLNFQFNPNLRTKLLSHLQSMLIDENELHKLLMFLSSCLDNTVYTEHLVVMWKGGALIKMINYVFGGYATRTRVVDMVRKNPCYSDIYEKNYRLILFLENEYNSVVRSYDGVRELIHDETVTYKMYNGGPETIIRGFHLMMVCDKLSDELFTNYCGMVKVIEFKDTSKNLENDFRNEFMLLLLEYYEKFKRDNYKIYL
jgi:hypothetical protein